MSNNFHLQLYRGTTAQNDAYTGLSGEVTVDTTLSKLRLHDGSTAGGVEIGGMPVGSIIPYAGTTIPAGYLLCDGSAISRTTYSALFAAIGTTYGAGDGNSTFNLPTNNDFPCGYVKESGSNVTLSSANTYYTALKNGIYFIDIVKFGDTNGFIFLQTRQSSTGTIYKSIQVSAASDKSASCYTNLRKNQVLRINVGGTYETLRNSIFYEDIGTRCIIKI